jgi:hypothetical protein
MGKYSVVLDKNVKYNKKPRKIGETIEIDEGDLEYFKKNKLYRGEAEVIPEQEKPLEKRTAEEVRGVAISMGIDGAEKMTKAQLLEAIQAKQAEQEKEARLTVLS